MKTVFAFLDGEALEILCALVADRVVVWATRIQIKHILIGSRVCVRIRVCVHDTRLLLLQMLRIVRKCLIRLCVWIAQVLDIVVIVFIKIAIIFIVRVHSALDLPVLAEF